MHQGALAVSSSSEGLSRFKQLQAGVGRPKTLLNTGRDLVTEHVASYVAQHDHSPHFSLYGSISVAY